MKKRTKAALGLTATLTGVLVYLSEKAAKKILKKEKCDEVNLDHFKLKRIRNSKGQILTGYFDDHQSDTTVLIVHTLTSTGLDMISYYDYFKDSLAQKVNANYLLIDLSGYGNSEGDKISLDSSYQDELHRWISYLKRNGTKKVVLFGKQFGANIIIDALKSLKNEDALKCIIVDGATVSNDKMIEDEVNQMYPLFYRTVGFMTKVILKFQYRIPFKHLDIIDNLKEYDGPILFIQSRKDPLTKFKGVFNIYNAKKDDKELILIKDQAYLYEYTDIEYPYYQAMFDFIADALNK